MNNIYSDISSRTNGDIYIGVVGPVRTGKSTFIKRFMEELVLPNIADNYKKERAIDELPLSSAGKTIMTTEPKFIPDEAVKINLDGNATLNVRMIDCVGYIVNSAVGHTEDDNPRMVSTPWYDEEIPFVEAAEIGTKKVISEHSTIGIVVTTDGSFSDISREDYIEAEERVVKELKAINKPFIILLNSIEPESTSVQSLKNKLEQKYDASVVAVNCQKINITDINSIISNTLEEFPIQEINIDLPEWVDCLDVNHWLYKELIEHIKTSTSSVNKVRDIKKISETLKEYEVISEIATENVDLGKGSANLKINTEDSWFYKILGETSGLDINGQESLINTLAELSKIKKEYSKIESALAEVNRKGYGIVSPTIDELVLEEPQIVKQGGRYGVKLKASAPSIHMIRADIETEVSPIVGTEKQSEDLVKYLLQEFEVDPKKIWGTNIFGKSLHELVNEGLHNKLYRMPDDAQIRLQETLQKIINEGSGGLICIIL